MNLNYLAFALPVFLVLIGLEYVVSNKKGKQYFQYSNTVVNLSVGIAERLLDLFVVGAFYGLYNYLHGHYALFDIQPSPTAWVLLFVFTDFVWYWYHRLAHEVNVLWSVHVVHHQSDDFNFSVSARITVFQAFVRTLFWCALPIIGFPAPMIAVMLVIHGVYPFFLHTRTIPKLGWLEYILVTPSHHRVHHASNEQYLDKNYGDVLIIWDKLFGTFIEESEEPIYGLTKPMQSKSFLWQHFHFALELLTAVRQTPGLGNKWKLLVGKPDVVDGTIRERLEEKYLHGNHTLQPTGTLRKYVNAQMALCLVGVFVMYLLEAYISLPAKVIVTGLVILTLINCGAILEHLSWVFHLEYLRFLISFGLLYYYSQSAWLLVGLGGVLVYSLLYFSLLQQWYLRQVYGSENHC